MRTALQFGLILTAALLVSIGLSPRDGCAQDVPASEAPTTEVAPEPLFPAPSPETAPPGIVFTEINLADDGVSAVDTSGREWIYDFSGDAWIERGADAEGGLTPDRRTPQDDLPIEARATQKRDVAAFERSVTIGYDEYVDGDVIAYDRVTIKGWVKGNVRSINKRVLVTESGRVDGDIEAPSVVVAEGGLVGGRITESEGTINISVDNFTRAFSFDKVVVILAIMALIMFVGFLAVAVIPGQLDRFTSCIQRNRVRSYALGFLFIFLMAPILVLLVITIVGILLIPFVPLVYFAAVIFGFISFGGIIGRRVTARLTGAPSGPQVSTFLGIALLTILWLGALLLLGGDGFTHALGILLVCSAAAITTYPVCTGVGAALLTRFGTREYLSWRERHPKETAPPVPAPPPLHQPPPVVAPGPFIIPPAPARPAPPPSDQSEPPPQQS